MTRPTALKLLRRALTANLLFSGLCALVLVEGAPRLASHLALAAGELVGIGCQLALFALLLGLLVSRPRLDRRWTLIAAALVSLADLAWVAGSVVALVLGLSWTATGLAAVLIAAAGTATLGTAQAIAVVALWRRGGSKEEEPSAPGWRGALLVTGSMALFALLYALLPWADLRPEAVRRAASAAAAESGRDLLHRAAVEHGLEALARHRTMEIVAVDEWAGASAWWPTAKQRFRAQRLLGTFTSRVELLDGPLAGEIRGVQSWQAYRHSSPGAPLELVERDPAITFYLPTLQYFDELPFRLLSAPVVLDAGTSELDGDLYRRLFVTWGDTLPHGEADQYDLWLDADTLRLRKVAYTVRDADELASWWQRPLMRFAGVGTMHFDDYRRIAGVLVPFRQTVTLGTPRAEDRGRGESFFHRLTVESARFDAIDPAPLTPIPGLPRPGDRKPAAQGSPTSS